jgi:hypothetical protein
MYPPIVIYGIWRQQCPSESLWRGDSPRRQCFVEILLPAANGSDQRHAARSGRAIAKLGSIKMSDLDGQISYELQWVAICTCEPWRPIHDHKLRIPLFPSSDETLEFLP